MLRRRRYIKLSAKRRVSAEAACGGAAGCVAAARTCCSRVWCAIILGGAAHLTEPELSLACSHDGCSARFTAGSSSSRCKRRAGAIGTCGWPRERDARAVLTVRCRARTFFCACCWRSGQPARSRAQPPAAPHASRPCGAAARRPPLVTRAAQEVDWSHCRYVATPLCRCTARSLRRYVSTPLCRYAATPLCRYAAMSLCRCVAVPRGAHARL